MKRKPQARIIVMLMLILAVILTIQAPAMAESVTLCHGYSSQPTTVDQMADAAPPYHHHKGVSDTGCCCAGLCLTAILPASLRVDVPRSARASLLISVWPLTASPVPA
jgi:hypothetical protein